VIDALDAAIPFSREGVEATLHARLQREAPILVAETFAVDVGEKVASQDGSSTKAPPENARPSGNSACCWRESRIEAAQRPDIRAAATGGAPPEAGRSPAELP